MIFSYEPSDEPRLADAAADLLINILDGAPTDTRTDAELGNQPSLVPPDAGQACYTKPEVWLCARQNVGFECLMACERLVINCNQEGCICSNWDPQYLGTRRNSCDVTGSPDVSCKTTCANMLVECCAPVH